VRVRLRAPSFFHLAALPQMLRGWKMGDVVAILGSIDIVLGEWTGETGGPTSGCSPS